MLRSLGGAGSTATSYGSVTGNTGNSEGGEAMVDDSCCEIDKREPYEKEVGIRSSVQQAKPKNDYSILA